MWSIIGSFVTILLLFGAWLPAANAGARAEINERRVAHGCERLERASARKVLSATRHSEEMRDAGYIFHSVLTLGSWSLVGEVVGVAQSIRRIVQLLFQSPEHREILLDCRYVKIAIGVARGSGSVWLTGRLYG